MAQGDLQRWIVSSSVEANRIFYITRPGAGCTCCSDTGAAQQHECFPANVVRYQVLWAACCYFLSMMCPKSDALRLAQFITHFAPDYRPQKQPRICTWLPCRFASQPFQTWRSMRAHTKNACFVPSRLGFLMGQLLQSLSSRHQATLDIRNIYPERVV